MLSRPALFGGSKLTRTDSRGWGRRVRLVLRARQLVGAALVSTSLTGVTNVLLPVSMQISSGSAGTGALALVATPLTVALSVQRAILSQTYLRSVTNVRHLHSTLIAIGTVATITSVLFAQWFGLSHAYLLLALASPFALYQDAFRFRVLGVGRGAQAAVSDAIWFVVFVTGLGGAAIYRSLSAPWILTPYVIGAGAASFCAWRLWPMEGGESSSHASLASLVAEGGLVAGLTAIAQPALAATNGLAALGAYRIAQVTGSISGLLLATMQGSLLRLTRIDDVRHVRRVASLVASVVGVVGLLIVGGIWVMPGSVLKHLKLDNNPSLIITVALVQASVVLSSWVMVLFARIRVYAPARSWLAVRIGSSVVELAVSVIAGAWLGAPGVALGTVVNGAVMSAYAGRRFRLDAQSAASS